MLPRIVLCWKFCELVVRNMKQTRDSGNVIYDNGKFVLIGGFDGQANELWKSTLEKKLLNK